MQCGISLLKLFLLYLNLIPTREPDYAHHIEISQQIFKQFRRACCCCCTHSTHSHNCILRSYSPVITKSTVKSNLFAVKNSAKKVQRFLNILQIKPKTQTHSKLWQKIGYGKTSLHINHHNSIYLQLFHTLWLRPELRTCVFFKSQWFKMPNLVRQSESQKSVAVL